MRVASFGNMHVYCSILERRKLPLYSKESDLQSASELYSNGGTR